MARYPNIDGPCPLSAWERSRIDGHCGHCNQYVHALDTMSDAGLAAFLQAATGSLCVSYRAPRLRSARFGVAIASTLIATTACQHFNATRTTGGNVVCARGDRGRGADAADDGDGYRAAAVAQGPGYGSATAEIAGARESKVTLTSTHGFSNPWRTPWR